MYKLIDLTGKRIGRLVVLKQGPGKRCGTYKTKFRRWWCKCDCGNTVLVWAGDLRKKATRSCGCLRSEIVRKRQTTHGFSKLREYRSWFSAKLRCLDKENPQYKDYGGRGIKMCKRWLDSVENFLKDMGPCPPDLTLERIDNDGNYEPGNCKWATQKEQRRNQRPHKRSVKVGQ